MAVLIFVIEASKGEETGFNPYRLGTDPTQMWAPTAVFSLTLILNVFIFIFFLVGIDKGLGFFEEHPKIVKRVVSVLNYPERTFEWCVILRKFYFVL